MTDLPFDLQSAPSPSGLPTCKTLGLSPLGSEGQRTPRIPQNTRLRGGSRKFSASGLGDHLGGLTPSSSTPSASSSALQARVLEGNRPESQHTTNLSRCGPHCKRVTGTRSLSQVPIHSFTHTFTHPSAHRPFIHPSIRPPSHPPIVHPPIYPSIHSAIHPPTYHPSIHLPYSFIPSLPPSINLY